MLSLEKVQGQLYLYRLGIVTVKQGDPEHNNDKRRISKPLSTSTPQFLFFLRIRQRTWVHLGLI